MAHRKRGHDQAEARAVKSLVDVPNLRRGDDSVDSILKRLNKVGGGHLAYDLVVSHVADLRHKDLEKELRLLGFQILSAKELKPMLGIERGQLHLQGRRCAPDRRLVTGRNHDPEYMH